MEIGTALFFIFCTPFGWIGLFWVFVIVAALRG